jgi:uncharacterized protein (TIGR03067 family)
MNIRHLSVVVALCVVSASIANCAEPAKTLEVLQGTWTGKETGREDAGVCKLKIEGNKMHFEGWHEKEWYKGTFKITSDQKHKQIHGSIADCPIPEFVDKVAKSIFKIEDGKLIIAGRRPGSDDVPNGFDDPKARHFILEKSE